MLDEIYKLFDAYPAIPVGMLVFVIIACVWKRRPGRNERESGRKGTKGFLSQVVFWWSRHDPLTVAGLLRSIAIFGASGSGKTTGSGYQLAKALIGMGRKVSLLILASKPEDREFWQRLFHKAGRARDLLVFSAVSGLRFNYLDFILRSGGDTRDITQAIMVIGETLQQNKGRESYEYVWMVRPARDSGLSGRSGLGGRWC